MKNVSIVLLVSLVVFSAGAQPDKRRENNAFGTAHEQQRAQLRSALKVPRELERQETAQAPERALRTPLSRHLSVQERSDLRQQLQQQRSATDVGTSRKQN